MLEDSPARLERAKALAALGSALRRADAPPMRASRCGGRWSWRARAGPTGSPSTCAASCTPPAPGRVPRPCSGADALTTSERRVADLAAQGQTNREIAQELFVTPKTVEVHLTSVYRKLGISSRRELRAALA